MALSAVYGLEQIGAQFQKKLWRLASLLPFGVLVAAFLCNKFVSTTPIERLENLMNAVALNIFYLSALLLIHAIKIAITRSKDKCQV